jgi:hypothetical protein
MDVRSDNAAYIAPISPRPLPTNMRQHSTPQGRQFEPMDVTRNQDLVELRVDIAAPLPPLQTYLYRPRFTAACTDEYTPAWYTSGASI